MALNATVANDVSRTLVWNDEEPVMDSVKKKRARSQSRVLLFEEILAPGLRPAFCADTKGGRHAPCCAGARGIARDCGCQGRSGRKLVLRRDGMFGTTPSRCEWRNGLYCRPFAIGRTRLWWPMVPVAATRSPTTLIARRPMSRACWHSLSKRRRQAFGLGL